MMLLRKILIFLVVYCVWVGVAGYLLFGLCTACLDPGPLQLASIGGYLVIIMIPVWLFIKWVNRAPGWVAKVEAQGTLAPATIVSVHDTGMVINNTVAVIKLQLRVEPPNEASFEVNLEKQISMLVGLGGYGYAPGVRLQVKYDPANHSHTLIVDEPHDAPRRHDAPQRSTSPEAGGSDISQKLAELAKLHKSGELSDAEYAEAKRKLLA